MITITMLLAMAAIGVCFYGAFQAGLQIQEKKLKITVALVIIGGGFAIAATGSRDGYIIDQDRFQVFRTETLLWGLIEKKTELRWMRGAEGGPTAWCAKGGDGKWYPYFVDYGLTVGDLR